VNVGAIADGPAESDEHAASAAIIGMIQERATIDAE
jgi:hypothetical protein